MLGSFLFGYKRGAAKCLVASARSMVTCRLVAVALSAAGAPQLCLRHPFGSKTTRVSVRQRLTVAAFQGGSHEVGENFTYKPGRAFSAPAHGPPTQLEPEQGTNASPGRERRTRLRRLKSRERRTIVPNQALPLTDVHQVGGLPGLLECLCPVDFLKNVAAVALTY